MVNKPPKQKKKKKSMGDIYGPPLTRKLQLVEESSADPSKYFEQIKHPGAISTTKRPKTNENKPTTAATATATAKKRRTKFDLF